MHLVSCFFFLMSTRFVDCCVCVFCVATGRKANPKKHVLLTDEVDGRQAMKKGEESK